VIQLTIKNDIASLWDNGTDKLCLFAVSVDSQYKYISGKPCITFGVAYENKKYKGCDSFTLFDHFYDEFLDAMKNIYRELNGSFRLDDNGADTDGYVDFEMKNGRLHVEGRLGATFSSYSLTFEFEADQTLLGTLIQNLAF
jgi:hypothetical protein